jgi:Fe-S-cluster containining protein
MQPPDISKTEEKRISARGFKGFLGDPDENGVLWIQRKEDDACFFLTKENKCAIYPVRPQVCRLEPFTIVDYDYKKNTIELELNFPFAECCVGTCDEKDVLPIQEIGRAAQILLQKILSLTANDLDLPVTDIKVHSETRSRLLRRTVEMADLQL